MREAHVSPPTSHPLQASPEQEALRERWEARLLRDHGPEWLRENRERLDQEWQMILRLGL
jgi:hypothetical protein